MPENLEGLLILEGYDQDDKLVAGSDLGMVDMSTIAFVGISTTHPRIARAELFVGGQGSAELFNSVAFVSVRPSASCIGDLEFARMGAEVHDDATGEVLAGIAGPVGGERTESGGVLPPAGPQANVPVAVPEPTTFSLLALGGLSLLLWRRW